MRACLVFAVLLFPTLAVGEGPGPAASPDPEVAPPPDEAVRGSEEVVTAIQERRFQLRHELTLGAGYLPFDSFTRGVYGQIAYTYHFGDHFAWQVGRGLYSANFATGLKQQLERHYNVAPTNFDQINWGVGSDLVLSPFYGKTTFFNRKLLWFEVYILGGGSVLAMKSGFAPAGDLGIGVRVFSTQALSVRFDQLNYLLVRQGLQNVATFQLSLALNLGGGPAEAAP